MFRFPRPVRAIGALTGIHADCLDVTVTGIATAHYEPHRIRLT